MATLQNGTIFNFQFSARARSMKNGTEAGGLVFLQAARIRYRRQSRPFLFTEAHHLVAAARLAMETFVEHDLVLADERGSRRSGNRDVALTLLGIGIHRIANEDLPGHERLVLCQSPVLHIQHFRYSRRGFLETRPAFIRTCNRIPRPYPRSDSPEHRLVCRAIHAKRGFLRTR